MTRHLWEDVDPLEFSDGVFYLPDMLEIQPRLPDWGHPDQPRLRERLANDRPHGVGGAKLLCLLCMRIQAERGHPRLPVWLTFVEGQYGPTFRHEDGRSPHTEHQPETDTHKALKEREARTWQAAGAREVDIEVWRPRARRKPDVLAVGPELTVAGEVQHSAESPRKIQNRQKSLRMAGDRVVWTTDRTADEIGFLHRVPHLAVPGLDDHRQYLRESRLEITAGVITFEEQRCGWADLWTGTNRCPVTRKAIPCGRWHLYPTMNPYAYSQQKAAIDGRFPCGPRPHLDHLLEGILHGSWLPHQHRNRVVWVPTKDRDRIEAERGGDVEQAESGTVRHRRQAAERSCERRYELMSDQRESASTASTPPRSPHPAIPAQPFPQWAADLYDRER